MINNPYFALLLFFLLTTGFLSTLILAAIYLGPKNPTRTKQLPFECGSVSVGNANTSRFSIRFYLLAMIFILFDIEIVFLYPWAANIAGLGKAGLWEMLMFSAVLALGLVFIWQRKVLDWNK